jgi:acetoin utilization deacetylase AcuC-like enzyme
LSITLHQLAAEVCDGRLALVLEGGYHLEPMRQSRDYLAANTPWLQ